MVRKTTKHIQKTYRPPQSAALTVMEETPDYTVPCPICEKRAIDVSELPERMIKLRYKCPHCRNIVVSPLTASGVKDVTSAITR